MSDCPGLKTGPPLHGVARAAGFLRSGQDSTRRLIRAALEVVHSGPIGGGVMALGIRLRSPLARKLYGLAGLPVATLGAPLSISLSRRMRAAFLREGCVLSFRCQGRRISFYLPGFEIDLIQRHLYRARTFFEYLTLRDHLSRYVKPESTVLDIGANIGNHTVYLAGVLGAKVHAFEPMPETYSLLARNVALNGLQDVVLHNVALGAREGAAAVDWFDGRNLGAVQLRYAPEGPIPTAMLDHVPIPERIDLIKIDVEGFEAEVLEGARGTISRDRPIVFMESTSGPTGRAADVLRSLGYVHLYTIPMDNHYLWRGAWDNHFFGPSN